MTRYDPARLNNPPPLPSAETPEWLRRQGNDRSMAPARRSPPPRIKPESRPPTQPDGEQTR